MGIITYKWIFFKFDIIFKFNRELGINRFGSSLDCSVLISMSSLKLEQGPELLGFPDSIRVSIGSVSSTDPESSVDPAPLDPDGPFGPGDKLHFKGQPDPKETADPDGLPDPECSADPKGP